MHPLHSWGRVCMSCATAEKEARARDQVAARSAVATEKAEQERLQGVIDDLEGRSGNAAKRLRSAELEGGNLRALATAACDKLEAMEKVADAMKEDLQRSNAYLAERDDAIMSLERKLSESLDQKKGASTCACARARAYAHMRTCIYALAPLRVRLAGHDPLTSGWRCLAIQYVAAHLQCIERAAHRRPRHLHHMHTCMHMHMWSYAVR